MSTVHQGSYEYIEGHHDSYQGMEIMSILGELSTLTGYHEYIGRYHDLCGGYHNSSGAYHE